MTDKLDTTAIRDVRKYKLVHLYGYQSQMLVRPDGSWVRHDDILSLCDALAAERAENARLRAALSNIIHTFTERSDGGLVTFPGGYYQAIKGASDDH